MKKILVCIVLSIALIVGKTPIFTYAINEDSFLLQESIESVISLTEYASIEEVRARIDAYVRSLPTVTDGSSEIPRDAINNAINEQFPSVMQTRSYFYEGKVELANVLSAYDGVSTTDLVAIMYHGYLAENDSLSREYPDAYRHTTWNFRATVELGVISVRIYTINFEWANQLIDLWDSYYDERYDYWYDFYYWSIMVGAMDIPTIIAMAQGDADDYICEYKGMLQTACRGSFDVFCDTFNNDNIMDWSNNVIGRNYGRFYSSYTPENIFAMACAENEVVLSPGI